MIRRSRSKMPRTCYLGVILISYLSQVWAQGGDPAIVDDIKPVVKPNNGEGSLICTVVNIKNSHVVYWMKDVIQGGGKDYFISENNRIVVPDNEERGQVQDGQLPKYDINVPQISSNKWSFILTIRHLTEEDSGNYSCKVWSIGQGYMATKKGNLMVQVPPTIRDGMKASETAELGRNVSLTCTAMGQPAPNITWRREDGYPLSTGGFQYRGATLNLINIQKKDAGNYLCVADNSVKPPAKFVVQIGVFYSPTCSAVQRTVGQAQNRRFNAKLECIVSGYPTPSVQWYRIENGGKVIINDNEKFATERMDSSRNIITNIWYVLTIKNVQANDYTEYFCVGRNTYGSNQMHFFLFETSECQGPNCPSISVGGANTVCACTLSLLSSLLAICLLKLMKY